MPIAYGGCAVAVGLSAACETVSGDYSPYSILGHFHGPASCDQKLYCSVRHSRDTRSFATRHVQVKQKQKDGSFRTCLEMMADFHVSEPSLWEYSAPPASPWPGPEDCPTVKEQAQVMKDRGLVSGEEFEEFSRAFGSNGNLFDTRPCLNGVAGQNLSGSAKNVITTQEGLPITSKTSAEWQRSMAKLETPAKNYAALAFLMDGALSFVPLTHGHLWFEDTKACSTLDFATRIFTPDIKMESWHLRERITSRGGHGRTYAEGRLWDDKGQLVASATQQSIMRLKRENL